MSFNTRLPSTRRTVRVYAPNDADVDEIALITNLYQAMPLRTRIVIQRAFDQVDDITDFPDMPGLPKRVRSALTGFLWLKTCVADDEAVDLNGIGTDDKVLNIFAKDFNSEFLDMALEAAKDGLFRAKSVYLHNLSEVLPENYQMASDFDFDALVNPLIKLILKLKPDEVVVSESKFYCPAKKAPVELLIHRMCLQIVNAVAPKYFTFEGHVPNKGIAGMAMDVFFGRKNVHIFYDLKQHRNGGITESDIEFFKALCKEFEPGVSVGLVIDWPGKYT